MNSANLCVFDFETGGKNPQTCVPLFVAARIFHPRNLAPVPGGDFQSLMRPKDDEWGFLGTKDGKEALQINRIAEAQLRDAPERAMVWQQFCSFLDRFNAKPGNVWTAPIACGMNILGFDLLIVDRLCREIGRMDKEGKPNIFNRKLVFDLLHILGLWFENRPEMDKLNMDAVRDHFGISAEGAHGANMVDVEQEGSLILRFLKLHRKLFERVPGLQGVKKDLAA